MAGMSSVIVGQPFDTIKVRLQTTPSFRSSFDVLRAASNSPEGVVSSLFKGMSSPLFTATLVNAIVFTIYGWGTRTFDCFAERIRDEEEDLKSNIRGGWDPCEGKRYSSGPASPNLLNTSAFDLSIYSSLPGARACRDTILEGGNTYEFWKNFGCGSFAGLVQCVVICPTEHIKCRLQTQVLTAGQQYYKGPIDCVKHIASTHGLQGIFRGWWVTCLREVPSFGLYFSSYDLLCDTLKEKATYLPNWGSSVLAGGVSGSVTWALVYPIDIAKTVIQTMPLETSPKNRRMLFILQNLVKEHGPMYLFRGLGVTVLRAFPVNGMIFPVYELCIYGLTTPRGEWRFKDVF
jgi:hypothetical protein